MRQRNAKYTGATRGTNYRLLATIAGLGSLIFGPAYAQNDNNETVEEIIVTGTSIRGAQPVGQNVVTIDRVDIAQSGAQSLQQILSEVPQITGFGNPGQGMVGSFDGTDGWSPTIHSLGASASNGTLVLIDGHRIPLSGISHTLADPNVIPPAAIERVEILPDGATAVYGSDAVAGVLNFVTRKNYEGIEVSGQYGAGDAYDTYAINLVTGTRWDGGSLVAAYSHSNRSALHGADRSDFYRRDLTSLGGRNFASFRCYPATVRVGGTRYTAPYGDADTISSAPCDDNQFTDLLPEDIRDSVLIGFKQDINERLNVHADVVYSRRNGESDMSRGGTSVTAYGPGSTPPAGRSINPYFVAPAGATSATVEFNGNNFFGTPGKEETGQRAFFVSTGMEYAVNDRWFLNVGGTIGEDISFREQFGALCSFCVNDAINGANLTTATALNVWGAPGSTAAGGADTSAAVRDYITDSHRLDEGRQSLVDVIAKVDGTLFEMPSGEVRTAVGVESIKYGLRQDVHRPGGTGPSSTASQTVDTHITRDVFAVFGEVLVPITDSLEVNLAVRRDDYDDFGTTTNPKVALQWKPMDSLRLRGSWGTSFTAPALTSRGEIATGLTTESGWGANGNSETLPFDSSIANTAAFLQAAPGCSVGADCNLGNVPGLRVTGGNKDLKAAEGETWSVGVDLQHPDWMPGLRVSLTYWDALYEGMITAPTLRNIINVPGLNDRIILLPTQAEVDNWITGLPQSSQPPDEYYWIWSFQQVNAFNIDAAGIDVDVSYDWETNLGNFSAGFAASTKTRFDQQSGAGDVWQDFLNVDANTTFSSLDFLGTLSLDWIKDNMSASFSIRHTGDYKKLGDSLQSTVDSYTTVDVYYAYDFAAGAGLTNGLQLFLQINDLTDEKPPFYNVSQGYNTSESSPIGRVTTVGFKKAWQ